MTSSHQHALPGLGTDSRRLRVVRSTKVEQLVAELAGDLADNVPADPLMPATIVVQSRGMQRWLSHQLAQQAAAPADITANVEFPFPGAMINTIAAACGLGVTDPDPWEPRQLAWRICELLADAADEPVLAPVRRFAAEGGVITRRAYQFATRVANVFDRYALYRTDLLEQWKGTDGHSGAGDWQPWLWRQLAAKLGDPTERIDHTIRTLAGGQRESAGLPASVALFGLSTLPPRYLEVFAALAAHVPVTWYLPVPSTARWQAIVQPGARAGSSATRTDALAPDDRPAGDATGPARVAGHPLVELCGRISDDTARLLGDIDVDDQIVGAEDADDEPGRSALRALQQAIAMDDPHVFVDALDGQQIDLGDASIQVHQCHSLARQVDALRDVVLGLFADHPHLQPRDVLLLTPDVEMVGPLLQAAAIGDDQRPGFPVRIADRRIDRDDPVIAAVRAVLELAQSRCTATDVLDVLAHPPISARFGLSADDLHDAGRWVRDTGIRWGIDAAHRARHGQPDEPYHTWRAGLDRLLLGIAMADEDDRMVGGVVPYDHVEGDITERVGAFVAACETLFDVVAEMEPASRVTWAERILAITTDLLTVESTHASGLRTLNDIVDSMTSTSTVGVQTDSSTAAGEQPKAITDRLTDLDTMVAAFDDAIAASGPAAAYETGAVTVCEFIPMRSIPQRVVGLIGMDDGAFPRSGRIEGFDLTQTDDRVGDRHRRDEDRHLFLEAIMAAREHLLVFATTRDQRTNQPVPPAVVVTELLETLVAEGESQAHVSTHPLHPYSPKLFGHGRPPRSFDKTLLPAAHAVLAGDWNDPPFMGPAEALDLEPPTHVDLDDLAFALGEPTTFFVQQQVGVDLREPADEQADIQPIDVESLASFNLGQQLLATSLDERSERVTIARGVVPAGALGAVTVRKISTEANALRQTVVDECQRDGQLLDVKAVQHHVVDVAIGTVSLTGVIGPVFVARPADGGGAEIVVAHERFSLAADRHLLRLWINHLAWHVACEEPITTVGVWRGKDSSRPAVARLRPVVGDDGDARAAASAHLADLLDVFALACKRPIPLFDVSRGYAKTGDMASAARKFRPSGAANRRRVGAPVPPPERERYLDWLYGHERDLAAIVALTGDEFAQLARRVWNPVEEHLSAVRRWPSR